MELKQLEYFLAISKLKSFTVAADQLYISQPGITSAIRRLEDELGIQLFAKNRKTAVLTPEGEVFANYIEGIMNDVSIALDKVEDLKNLNTGTINIGISPVTSISVTSFLLTKFKVLYPDLKLNLIEGSSDKLQKLLETEKLDIAFLLLENIPEFLQTMIIGTQELFVGLPSVHLLKGKEKLTLTAIKNEHFILLKKGCPVRTTIDAAFDSISISPKINFETNYIQAIQRFMLCGAGITLLPIEAFENNTNFVTVPLDPPLSITTFMAYKKNRPMSHATQTFQAFIKSSCTA